jgi:NodT family efflux transporter outer membrane factor (OMF) lipoprotein
LGLLSGCAVGPDFVKPTAPADSGYAPTALPKATSSLPVPGGAQQDLVEGKDIRFDWWKEFGSPALDHLVEQALRNNPTITVALASLRQAQEMVYAQQAGFLPTIGADYNFQRQQVAGNLSSADPGPQGNGQNIQPSGPAAPTIFNMHTAQLQVSYSPDVLGANRRQVEALDAQAESQRYLLQAAYVTLINNVVATAIQEAGIRDQIAATKALIADNVKMVEILRAQYKLGFAMAIDLATAEQALAAAEQTLPPLTKQLDQTRDMMRALLGNLPNQEVEEIPSLAALHLPTQLPLSLPSKIIEQRPDVRAAEEAVRSANAQVGVAIAARLPQFALSGSFGGAATQFDQMFAGGGPFWTIIGDIAMPIFDGNALLHKERAADQALIQANEQYRGTVIAAYQNVADSLHAITADADALKAAGKAEGQAKVILDVTRRQNQLGYVDWLTLYGADVAYQQALLGLVQAQAARYGDTAALYQALGGGWWNRANAVADNTSGDFVLDWTKILTP